MADDWVIAALWWAELQPKPDHPAPAHRPGDRAALARLRRCERVEESGSEAAALDLARRIGIANGRDPRLGDALLAATVLAHVLTDDRARTLGGQLGPLTPEQRPKLSPWRLTRLLAADTLADRLVAFRRVVTLLGGSVNVRDLARMLLHWTEQSRINLVFDYHNAAPPGSGTVEIAPGSAAGDVA